IDANEQYASYRAVTPSERPVELRVLSQSSRNSRAWGDIVKQYKLAALVHHPAVRPTLDLALEKDPPFVVLEYVPGKTLAEEHGLRPLTFLETIQTTQRLAEGLAAIHRLGITHGNIAPTTIYARSNQAQPNHHRDWMFDIPGLASPHQGQL